MSRAVAAARTAGSLERLSVESNRWPIGCSRKRSSRPACRVHRSYAASAGLTRSRVASIRINSPDASCAKRAERPATCSASVAASSSRFSPSAAHARLNCWMSGSLLCAAGERCACADPPAMHINASAKAGRSVFIIISDWTSITREWTGASTSGPLELLEPQNLWNPWNPWNPWNLWNLFLPNHRIVEEREHPAVQLLDVEVERIDEVGQDRPHGRGHRHRLKLVRLRDRRPVLDVGAREAAGDDQELQRLGVQRPDVRDVADVAFEECDPARRVQRFEDDPAARPELVEGELEKGEEVAWLQVFDDLRGEQPAKGFVRHSGQVTHGVRFGDVKSTFAAGLDHLVIQVDAACGDARPAEELQELPPAAADVEDVRCTLEEGQIALESRPDVFPGSAKAIFERQVLVGVQRRREGRRRQSEGCA